MYSTGKYSHQFLITSNGDGEGQRSLVCCSPWHRKELDTIERLNNNFKWSIICKNIESLCCMLETNTVLLINHTLIEKKRESREMLSPRLQTPPTCPELSWMHCLSERGGTGASLPAPPTLTTSAVCALFTLFWDCSWNACILQPQGMGGIRIWDDEPEGSTAMEGLCEHALNK